MTPGTLIICWAGMGAAVGGLLALWARSLLRISQFSPRAWGASAALTAILFAVLAWRLGIGFDLLAYSYLAAVSVPLSMVDLAEQRLPSVVVLPSYLVLGATFAIEANRSSNHVALVRALVAMAVLAAAYLVLALGLGGLGAGDVKFAGLLGLALGWLSWGAVLAGTSAGWLLAVVVRVVLRLARRVDPDEPLPLGPYLAVGALMTIAAGPPA